MFLSICVSAMKIISYSKTIIQFQFLFSSPSLQQQAMEKRMDRWQRLRFGRRATSNPPEDKKPTIDSDLGGKRSSDKLERLREITELLKVSRASNAQSADASEGCCSNDASVNPSHSEIPPVPPPRKPRTSLSGRNSGSIEKFIDTSASESGSPALDTKFDHAKSENMMATPPTPPPLPYPPILPPQSHFGTLRPNSSATNLESILKLRDRNKTMLALPEEHCNETPTKFVQPTKKDANRLNAQQKSVPFRSASFSQVDYSSGKYIRSALGALKASLSKAKSPPLSFACRRDRSECSSPDDAKSKECTDIWIPLKGPCDKRNDLNLDLINTSATILEEDCEYSPTSNSSEAASTAATTTKSVPNDSLISLKMINAAQMTTDSPHDESANIQGVDNYFQSATACLIPVPVYECAHPDDSIATDKWSNACERDSDALSSTADYTITDRPLVVETDADQIPAFSEIQQEQSKKNALIDSEKRMANNKNSLTANDHIYKKLRRKTQSPTLEIDGVPSIAVTPGSSVSGSSFEEIDNSAAQPANTAVEYGSEFGIEVRKRYSNDTDKTSENRSDDSNPSTSTSGTNSPKSQHNEKRRIDKSKRRKGMYIQWATLDKHNKELSAVSWTVGDGPADELCERNESELDDRSGQLVWPTEMKDAKPATDSIYTPPSMYNNVNSPGFSCDGGQSASASCDTPFTPDSDYGQRPSWPRGSLQARRQSLSLQSSEEKDDAASPPILTKPRSKIFLLRSDSTSDNEMSDRTPPPRDRTSQSPAPDYDFKRYSKRPLRGPYGQMLEAEMKKPTKQNYDGLLEELNRSER